MRGPRRAAAKCKFCSGPLSSLLQQFCTQLLSVFLGQQVQPLKGHVGTAERLQLIMNALCLGHQGGGSGTVHRGMLQQIPGLVRWREKRLHVHCHGALDTGTGVCQQGQVQCRYQQSLQSGRIYGGQDADDVAAPAKAVA